MDHDYHKNRQNFMLHKLTQSALVSHLSKFVPIFRLNEVTTMEFVFKRRRIYYNDNVAVVFYFEMYSV